MTLTPRDLSVLGQLTTVGGFRAKAEQFILRVREGCIDRPYEAAVIYGLRSRAKQLSLYSIGRELVAPDADPALPRSWKQTGRVVTKALPHDSAHCYGAAIDLALIDRVTHRWVEDANPGWDFVGATARLVGLESGHFWHFKDSAHGELVGWRELVELGELVLVEV